MSARGSASPRCRISSTGPWSLEGDRMEARHLGTVDADRRYRPRLAARRAARPRRSPTSSTSAGTTGRAATWRLDWSILIFQNGWCRISDFPFLRKLHSIAETKITGSGSMLIGGQIVEGEGTGRGHRRSGDGRGHPLRRRCRARRRWTRPSKRPSAAFSGLVADAARRAGRHAPQARRPRSRRTATNSRRSKAGIAASRSPGPRPTRSRRSSTASASSPARRAPRTGSAAGEYMAGHTSHDPARSRRRRRLDRAVELSADDARLEDLPGARGRQHGGAEAVRADAADGAEIRRDRRRSAAGRRLQPRARPRRYGRRRPRLRSRACAWSRSPATSPPAARCSRRPRNRSSAPISNSAARRR